MSHKADETFFEAKREWSRRKDRLLGSYITAYLPKMATQNRPILIVDGFAGPGRFGDGEPGSPLILAEVIQQSISRGLRVPVELICIELVHKLAARLRENLSGFIFARVEEGQFIAHSGVIESAARTHHIFLYLDPFTVEGLVWNHLDQIASHLGRSGTSVEVLVNFNAASFVRRGLSALALHVPGIDPDEEDTEEADAAFTTTASISKLDEVVGTDDWQPILRASRVFADHVRDIEFLFRTRLNRRFAEVGSHAVLAKPTHMVPKYYLIFGSRHPQGLELMNDEVVKSRRTLADLARPASPTLFETRSLDLVPDLTAIPVLLRALPNERRPRREWIQAVMRQQFGEFSKSEVRRNIESLLKAGEMRSGTGRTRINDETAVWFA